MAMLIERLNTILGDIRNGSLDSAEAGCGALLAEHPTNPDGWHLKGLMHHLRGDQETAVKEFSKAIRFTKKPTADMLTNRAAAYFRLGKWSEAVADLRGVVDADPDNALACLKLAYGLNELDRYAEAETYARRAATSLPQLAEARATLARALYGTGRFEEAREECEAALALDPQCLGALIALGSVCIETGRFAEAIEAFEAALEQNRGNPILIANLGRAYEKQRRWDDAEAHFRMAVELAPDVARYYLDLGTVLAARRRFELAEATFRLGLEKSPGHLELTRNLGLALRDQRKYEEAESLFRELLGRRPKSAAVHAQLGITLWCAGRVDDAEIHFDRAMELEPDHADALFGKASVLNRRGEYREAASILQQVLIREPDHLDCVRLLISIHEKRKEISEARRWLQYLSRREADHPDTLVFMGCTYGNLGDSAAMIDCLEKAAAIDPEHRVAATTLASVLEIRNRVDEAEGWLDRAKSLGGESFAVDFAEIRLLRRRQKYEEALALAEASLARPFGESDRNLPHEERDARTMIPYEKGALLDRSGRYEEAFEAFIEGNVARRSLYRVVDRLRKAVDRRVDGCKRLFQKTWVASWTPPLSFDEQKTPVFLVGFPRSGTTLLGQILDSHPELDVLEEPETVERIAEDIRDSESGFGWTIANLEHADFIRLRNHYFRQVERHLPRRTGKILVEKMPLNLINAGLIRRVFPSAKFVFLKRHPCDACLSCFMQGFTVNPAMSHFYDLDETTKFYVRVMELWKQYREVLKFPCHEMTYEGLLGDFEGETRRLLEFVGVDWNDSVREYHTHAAGRQDIITPSYRQVTQPIYTTAQNRWKRYEQHLEPYLERLQPFIEEFGYGEKSEDSENATT